MWRVYRRTSKEQDYTNYVEGLYAYQKGTRLHKLCGWFIGVLERNKTTQTMWRVYRRTRKEQDYTNYVVGICVSERNKTAQTMWRVYRRTRKEQDCTNYVESL